MTIISFRYNFIFIKTTKTAGTSIEVDLSRLAGEDAIVTPVTPPEPGHRARNYLDAEGSPAFFNHMPATLIRERIGAARFDSMFKFCVEREPVEKCLSYFHMLCNSPLHRPAEGAPSWAGYCAEGPFPVDVDKYSEIRDGKPVLLVDRILRYDALQDELAQVMRQLGIRDFALRSTAKSEYSRNVVVRPAEVTPAQRTLIETAFAQTCALTGLDWSRPARQDDRATAQPRRSEPCRP